MSHKGLALWIAAALGVAATARADCPLPNPASCIYVDDNCNPPSDGTAADPFCTIQEAYDAATAGKTILVKAGNYNECVFASGFIAPGDPLNVDKGVKLIADEWQKNQVGASAANFDTVTGATVIDGTGICDGVFPQPSQPTVFLGGTGASIQGFKVTGGGDAGIAAAGSVAITNNLITGNVAQLGGGVYFYSATCTYGDVDATIDNDKITGNFADDFNENGSGSGGGIWVWARGSEPDAPNSCTGGTADVAISNNLVTQNQASNTIQNALTQDLVAVGGGIYAQTDTPQPAAVPAAQSAAHVAITQNLVQDNEIANGSAGYGAGIWANTFGYGIETMEVRDNTVTGNLSPGTGGGISAWVTPQVLSQHELIVDGNTVSTNTALVGGGMDLLAFVQDLGTAQSFSLVVSHNTIVDNTSSLDGGGVFVEYTSRRSATAADAVGNSSPAAEMTFLVKGNTIKDNIAGLGGGGAIVYVTADADPEGATVCLPTLQDGTAATAQFVDNLIVGNTAQNFDPAQSGDIIGAGMLLLPAAFGEAKATVSISTSTIADNQISSGGFVGGIEIAGFTDLDCDTTDEGQVFVTIDRSIITGNDLNGIGGPNPDPNQTVTVTKSSSFGNGNVDYENTLFPGGTPPNNFATTVDPLLDVVTFVPDSCSPMFNVGECGAPAAPGQTCFSVAGLASAPAPPACPAGSSCVFVGAGPFENPDINEDNQLDGVDLLHLAVAFGAQSHEAPTAPDARYDASADFDRNGVVDGNDLSILSPDFGRVCQP
jgi:hypothetical protein